MKLDPPDPEKKRKCADERERPEPRVETERATFEKQVAEHA
jgi:hypothetical protein